MLADGSLGFGQELSADPLVSSMEGNVVDDEKLLMRDDVGKAKQSAVVAAVTDQAGVVIADHVPMDSPELMQSPDDNCEKLKQLAAILEASQSVTAGRKRRTSIMDENSLARAERLNVMEVTTHLPPLFHVIKFCKFL
jgi:predicted house-cleaning NTP pyrophosphatase (Maf/HAM1 superfamily)